MNFPTYLTEPQVQNLQQIIEDIERGRLLVPRFQRLFQWTDEQRLALLQSIREGVPIGSILVWRTTEHKLDTFHSIAGAELQGANDEPAPWQYLLDGHQRLTTLFGSLRAKRTIGQSQNRFGEVADQDWNIYFDLKNEEFFLRGRTQPAAHCIPTNILLDSVALLRFQRDLTKNGAGDELVEAADRLALAIRNYKIPVIPIVTNDLRSVTVAFQRVNSGGTAMSDADMVIALTFDKEHDLRIQFEESAAALSEVGWSELDPKYILAVVRVRKELDIAKPDAGKTSEVISANPHFIKEATESVIKVANFLRKYCNIGGPNVVPYSYQSVLLAEAMRLNPNPDPRIVRELVRWFWATSYAGYFLGARDREVALALKEVKDIVAGKSSEFANRRIDIDFFPLRFDFRAARCKAISTRLVEMQPQGMEDSFFSVDPITAVGVFGPDALIQLIPRRFVGERYSGPENRFVISRDATQVPFAALRTKREFPISWWQSHGVSEQGLDAWRREDYVGFLNLRRATLMRLELDFLESLELQSTFGGV